MLDLRQRRECVWDDELRPIGEGEIEKEPFAAWWARHGSTLGHLEPRIAEQWVYRHWSNSYMSFLDLTPLQWRLESWTGDQILAQAHMEFGGPFDANHDDEVFNGGHGFGPNQTARAMNAGTWDMPLLLLDTPSGIQSFVSDLPDVRFVVAEGSKRMRYLYAQRARGAGEGPHDVFILSSPQAA